MSESVIRTLGGHGREVVGLLLHRDTIVGIAETLRLLQASAFVSPFVKERFLEMHRALFEAAASPERVSFVDEKCGAELAEAVERAIAAMDEPSEPTQQRLLTSWYAEWSVAGGAPHDKMPVAWIERQSLWEFEKAVRRAGRHLPPGCLEWASHAEIGDAARWYEAKTRTETLVKVVGV